MRHLRAPLGVLVLVYAIGWAGCGDETAGPRYEPTLPTEWAASVTNPWFPLLPGTSWRYQGETGDGLETTVVEVQSAPRMVNGVAATVVRDRVYLDGDLTEDTSDWYAQDSAGNVWYLGEDSKEVRNGTVVGTEGSWEWGVKGALPGIIMWADPAAHLNEAYRQEYARGEAEDWGKVVGSAESVQVVYGSFTGCIRTEDWSGLEGRSSSLENKLYCRDIGTVEEMPAGKPGERIELVQLTRQ
jgi:hypothetical protein